MSGYLWKITANKNWGKVLKGMTAEIIVNNRSGKPNTKEIYQAIETKYNIKIGAGMPESTFDFEKG